MVGGLVAMACGGNGPVLSADPSGAALFEQGQNALVDEDWRDAASSFDTLLKNYPSSPFLADARLGLGRGYYEQRTVSSLILAIDAFQAFLTYHPSHEQVDYAQYMIGMSYVAQMRSPDRDQTPTRNAIEAFDSFLEDYPQSSFWETVVQERLGTIDSLAEHELGVARWQARFKELWPAATERAQWALEHYPETTLKCELTFVIGEAYKKGEKYEDAVRYYQEVINDYPDCELAEEAQERIRNLRGVWPAALGGGRVS